jgi:hypothetical protein
MIDREGDRDSVLFAAPRDRSPAGAVSSVSAELSAAAPLRAPLGSPQLRRRRRRRAASNPWRPGPHPRRRGLGPTLKTSV